MTMAGMKNRYHKVSLWERFWAWVDSIGMGIRSSTLTVGDSSNPIEKTEGGA